MKRWFVILVWLLTLALPLQGLAAVTPTMAFGSMHDSSSGHDAAEAAEQPPCHSADIRLSDGASGTHAGCTQCAVCHAGSAPLPPEVVTPGTMGHTQALPGWTQPAPFTVDLAGLDRPPRTHHV